MGDLGLGELIVILLVVVVLFGANRLPQAAAGLGKAIRNFKDEVAGKGEQKADGGEGGGGGSGRGRTP